MYFFLSLILILLYAKNNECFEKRLWFFLCKLNHKQLGIKTTGVRERKNILFWAAYSELKKIASKQKQPFLFIYLFDLCYSIINKLDLKLRADLDINSKYLKLLFEKNQVVGLI